MRRPPRIVFLTLILGGVALWIVLDNRMRDDSGTAGASAPGAPGASAPGARPARTGASAAMSARRTLAPLRENPFRAGSWDAASAGPGRVARRAPPAAPPLPFRFVGRVYQGATTQLYLARGDKLYSVKQGDTLDGQYLVESVSGTSITFLHRPSGTRQIMRLAAPLERGDAQRNGG